MLDHFESDAVLCGGLGRLLARVSLIDVSQLHVLPGRFLYLLGELLELLSVVLVGRAHAHSEQVSQSVHRSMHLRALLVLVSVVAAPRAALGGRPQRARVHYGRLRLRSPLLRKPQKYAQIVDHLLEHSRLEPSLRLLVDGFPCVGRSWGMYRHAEPVRTTHLSPFKTSRRSYSRWGASSRTSARYGATNVHSSSATSLGYGFRVAMTRCYRVRAKVHNTLYERVFADEYFGRVPEAWRDRLPVHYAGAALKMAVGFFRRREAGWPAKIESLLNTAGESLA